jgi:hypothetical protein
VKEEYRFVSENRVFRKIFHLDTDVLNGAGRIYADQQALLVEKLRWHDGLNRNADIIL